MSTNGQLVRDGQANPKGVFLRQKITQVAQGLPSNNLLDKMWRNKKMYMKKDKSGNGEYPTVCLNDKVNKEIWEKRPFIF